MATIVHGTPDLIRCMINEGLVPEECVDIIVEFRVDALPQIIYRVNLDEARIGRFQRAFTRYLEPVKS